MTETRLAHMMEAARLTRAGRLTEATALLQHALRDGGGSEAPPAQDGAGARGTPAREPRLIDVDPDTGEATVPGSAEGPSASPRSWTGRWSVGRPGEAMAPRLPTALRKLINEARRGGSSSPSEAPPDGAQFITRSFTSHAGSRAYKLYVPASGRREAMPLVVMLHGCNQSPDDFAAGTRMNLLAEVHGCLIAYPEQSQAANGQKCWNWFSPGHQARDRGEPALIAGITQQIVRDHAADGRRVYVAGLSAGGAAAAIMAAAYPDVYAAVGVHSGLACGAARDMTSAFAAMRQGAAVVEPAGAASAAGGRRRLVPTIVFHGDEDATVHPRNGEQVIDQSGTSTGLRVVVHHGKVPGGHAYKRTTRVDERGEAVLEQWLVHGAGHAWSGGSADGSYTDPRGPDASHEMLRFFLSHALGA